MFEKILEKYGLKYENLNYAEKETLQGWMQQLSEKKLTLDDVKAHIRSMMESVEQELTETSHNSKQDLFLKARLKNYILLEACLDSPEKAKKAFAAQIEKLGNEKAK